MVDLPQSASSQEDKGIDPAPNKFTKTVTHHKNVANRLFRECNDSDGDDECRADLDVPPRPKRPKTRKMTRMRAEPFFREIVPGWRARDKGLFCGAHLSCVGDSFSELHGTVADHVQMDSSQVLVPASAPDHMALGGGQADATGFQVRGDSSAEQGRQTDHLGNEERRSYTVGRKGTRSDSESGREGNSDNIEREVAARKGSDVGTTRTSGTSAKGLGENVRGQTGSRVRDSRVGCHTASGSAHSAQDTTADDIDDQGASGTLYFELTDSTCTDSEHCDEFKTFESQAIEPNRWRLGDGGWSLMSSSAFRWAATTLTGLNGRAQTLVSRVMCTASSEVPDMERAESAHPTSGASTTRPSRKRPA